MSNAMRFGKRTLAGVAAGALALGMLSFVGATTATAAPKIKPKAINSLSATSAGPVRVSFAGTTLEAVPYAGITWTPSANLTGNETAVVALTSAPSPTAQLGITRASNIATQAVYTTNAFSTASGYDTVVLGTPSSSTNVLVTGVSATAGWLGVAANQSGTYAGTITVGNVAGNVDVVGFSFTTTGAATSLTLAPATQNVSVGGTANFSATLKDAAGNVTQPLWVDSIGLVTTGGTLSSATLQSQGTTFTDTGSRAASLFDGVAAFAVSAITPAGTYTVTATPAGTLPSGGVLTQAATIVASGNVSTAAVTGLSVSVPAVAFNGGIFPNKTAQVPVGTTAVTVKVTGGTSNASKTVRFNIAPSAGGTINGSTSAQNVSVSLDAFGNGTLPFTIGGASLASGGTATVTQVDQANNTTITGNPNIQVVQTNANINSSTVAVDPSGAVTTKLGSTVPVNVFVGTQYGEPVSGVQVAAYRSATSVAGTAISSGVTNAKGIATLTLSGATGITAGTVEQYSITILGSTTVNLLNEVQVTYTTGGDVTSMTVQVGGAGVGVTNPITNTTTSIPVIPNVVVPYTGDVETVSAGAYVVATGAAVAATGNYAEFTPTPVPGNPVTVTAPEGVKVVTALEYAIGQDWTGGSQSATISSGSPVYIFGTKTGTFDVTFKSGSITTTTKVRVSTVTEAAYNVSLTPAKQDLEEGDFSKVTVKVTDVFGNGVSNSANANFGVTLTAAGPVLLAGQTQSTTLTSYSAAGTDVTVLSSSGMAGLATLKLTPSSAAVAAANGAPSTSPWSSAGYVKPTGAADPVKEATAEVLVRAGAQKTISISGGRTTVSGKPGIEVVGFADGFANGDKVKPWIRFPGQTTYTAGTARPVVTDEEFKWSRKTGKKSYIYFTSEDDAILSNRIIIAAN